MNEPVYEYEMTKPDFLKAQRLYLKHRPKAAALHYFWNWFLPLAGVSVVLLWIYRYETNQSAGMAALSGLAAAGLWCAMVIPVARWFQINRLWKVCVPPELEGKPLTLQFDSEQVISAIPGRSEGRFFWTAILDFVEDEHLALLFIRKKQFLMIPKAALPESAWHKLRTLALAKLDKVN